MTGSQAHDRRVRPALVGVVDADRRLGRAEEEEAAAAAAGVAPSEIPPTEQAAEPKEGEAAEGEKGEKGEKPAAAKGGDKAADKGEKKEKK